jgi:acetyl esterase/lipase
MSTAYHSQKESKDLSRRKTKAVAETVPPNTVNRLVAGISYRSGRSAPARCKLDIHYPVNAHAAPVLVWIHGGGLREQEKWVPIALQDQGFVIVAPDYRLDPDVRPPVYVQDVAAAVAWVLDHIAAYGGDPDRVVISGHSAGCYLGDLVVMDRSYLAAHGHEANRLVGNASLSAHKITHATVRETRGLPGYRAAADSLAPLCHVRADAPPTLLVTGDRELELPGRYEENALFWRMMKLAGHPDVELIELPGLDHGSMLEPACELLSTFTRRVTARTTTLLTHHA